MPLSTPRAHTTPPHKADFLLKTLKPRKNSKCHGRARTAAPSAQKESACPTAFGADAGGERGSPFF
jgi:hypothetical protein